MTSENHSDAEVIRRIRTGSIKDEHQVVSQLLQTFRGLVNVIVLKPGFGTKEDAQDVLNDAVSDLLVQVRSDRFQLRDAKLSTFFYAIAKNRWLNILRHRSKQLVVTDLPASDHLDNGQDSGILNRLIASEQKKQVHRALKHLDDPCFAILYRYWICDMKLKDMATELGISEEAVKKRHERCRKKLRAFLKRDPRKQ